MNPDQSDDELLEALGAGIAGERLSRNWTQAQLAREAGVSRPTVARMEGGRSTQLSNLVRVLRALGLVERLRQLVPERPISPIEALEHKGRRRQRASGRRANATRETVWRWGEDDGGGER